MILRCNKYYPNFIITNWEYLRSIGMKPSTAFLIFIVLTVWACVLFSGFVTALKKTIKPAQRSKLNADQILQEQRQFAADTKQQHAQLMESQRQKMDELKHRADQGTSSDARTQQEQTMQYQRQMMEDSRRRAEESRQRMQDLRRR